VGALDRDVGTGPGLRTPSGWALDLGLDERQERVLAGHGGIASPRSRPDAHQ
jgi:hypothetical protein